MQNVRKNLVYAPLAALSHHFETDLEITQDLLNSGQQVVYLTCGGALKRLNYEACKGLTRCMLCRSKQKQGVKILGNSKKLKIQTIDSLLNSAQKSTYIPPSEPLDFEATISLSLDNLDYGAAALSTLITNIREPEPNIGKYWKELRSSFLLQIEIYLCLIELFKREKFDRLYFFNGRLSLYRPALRAAQKMNIDFFCHERGANNNLYHLSHNTYPHDLTYRKHEINNMWSLATNEQKNFSKEWFQHIRNGKALSWYSFVDDQKTNTNTVKIDKSKQLIGIFISSEDEMVTISGWENPLFNNQNAALSWIADTFTKNTNIQFVIRSHPNLRGIKNSQTLFLSRLNRPNIQIIAAESLTSSYEVISLCDKIIVFASTIGVEAAYMGKPTILVGRAFYEDLQVCYVPKTRDELTHFITAQNLPPLPAENAIPYANWISNFGQPYRHYKPINLSKGHFNGIMICGSKLLLYINGAETLIRSFVSVFRGQNNLKFIMRRLKNKIGK